MNNLIPEVAFQKVLNLFENAILEIVLVTIFVAKCTKEERCLNKGEKNHVERYSVTDLLQILQKNENKYFSSHHLLLSHCLHLIKAVRSHAIKDTTVIQLILYKSYQKTQPKRFESSLVVIVILWEID